MAEPLKAVAPLTEPIEKAEPSKVLRNVGIAVAIVLSCALAGFWFYDRITHIVILDARIAGSMVMISSRVPGWVDAVPVDEGQRIAAKTTLLRIDTREATLLQQELAAEVAVVEAEADAIRAQSDLVRSSTANRLQGLVSALEGARSDFDAARSRLNTTEAEWARASSLRRRNLLSQQELETRRNTLEVARQNVRRMQANVVTAEAQANEARAAQAELTVLQAELVRAERRATQKRLELQRASANVDDHNVTAPSAGVIDEVFVDPGEYVVPGQRVLIMHDPAVLWVRANVKETDVRHLRLAQPVEITIDAYPSEAFTGTISRIGASATNQFALLPNPNPSGNFTKITQRIELAVALDVVDPRMKPGMMVVLRFDKIAPE